MQKLSFTFARCEDTVLHGPCYDLVDVPKESVCEHSINSFILSSYFGVLPHGYTRISTQGCVNDTAGDHLFIYLHRLRPLFQVYFQVKTPRDAYLVSQAHHVAHVKDTVLRRPPVETFAERFDAHGRLNFGQIYRSDFRRTLPRFSVDTFRQTSKGSEFILLYVLNRISVCRRFWTVGTRRLVHGSGAPVR